MNESRKTATVLRESIERRIAATLFGNKGAHCFAVLDGAAIPPLIDSLDRWQPKHVCLYRGVLSPELLCAAPYLVQLEEQCPFCHWLLANAKGRHWGIFAMTNADLRSLARHFRRLHLTRDEEGRKLAFRFYDPRVLDKYLPLFTAEQRDAFFGPVLEYVTEQPHPPYHLSVYTQASHQTDKFAQV